MAANVAELTIIGAIAVFILVLVVIPYARLPRPRRGLAQAGAGDRRDRRAVHHLGDLVAPMSEKPKPTKEPQPPRAKPEKPPEDLPKVSTASHFS
jgi:hypothetical protein